MKSRSEWGQHTAEEFSVFPLSDHDKERVKWIKGEQLRCYADRLHRNKILLIAWEERLYFKQGYKSWPGYCKGEFHISGSMGKKIVRTLQLEREIGMPEKTHLDYRIAAELLVLPERKQRQNAYETLQRIGYNDKITAKLARIAVAITLGISEATARLSQARYGQKAAEDRRRQESRGSRSASTGRTDGKDDLVDYLLENPAVLTELKETNEYLYWKLTNKVEAAEKVQMP